MKNTNVQHIELASNKDGLFVYVNGEPMPYLTWQGDSLKNLGSVMGLAGLPYGDLITKLMPIIQRTGVNMVLRFPTQDGAAEIPVRDPSQAPVVAEAVASDQPAALVTKIDVSYDENGQPITGSFMDYALPRAGDIPPMVVGDHPSPATSNPLGTKGCGEAGCAGSLATLVNAVLDALSPCGIRHRDMPLTPERVWRAIQNAKAKAA